MRKKKGGREEKTTTIPRDRGEETIVMPLEDAIAAAEEKVSQHTWHPRRAISESMEAIEQDINERKKGEIGTDRHHARGRGEKTAAMLLGNAAAAAEEKASQ